MSVKLSAFVWDGCASSGMKLASVAVMARLADFSSDDGICWPSIETIARQLGAGPSTVRTTIAKLEKDGWLTRTQRRKGNRNASNMYQLNVAKLYAAAQSHLSDSDPSKSDTSNSDASKFDPSKSSKNGGFHPPESGGDPSVRSKQDPSDKKTIGQPPPAADPQSDNLRIDYRAVLDAYHTTLPEIPKVLEMTDDRRKKLRALWTKYDFNLERWFAYLRYISKHCRWMLENRADTSTGRTWRKKNFDYLITEKCYLAVKEERANDLPNVERADVANREEAFTRLVSSKGKPKNRTEEIAQAEAGRAGLGRMNAFQAMQAWKTIWASAAHQAGEEELRRLAS
ncbi:helix-turn-helix domain-containing protein [Pectobacterium brasiliense]|uniref:helix-turn-helix domain-containing protein n=1 Tax=Pectobacterium brasiliense TaxID=180957 RepID=UPI001968A75D|nr:helix-turn-helix domain-containing protein [Pectobacterium brasiliense]MBN3057960.1 helix-turn-helix domain-containing protein [Pectobacterium brasiliense]